VPLLGEEHVRRLLSAPSRCASQAFVERLAEFGCLELEHLGLLSAGLALVLYLLALQLKLLGLDPEQLGLLSA
jgi:hypothetical protein